MLDAAANGGIRYGIGAYTRDNRPRHAGRYRRLRSDASSRPQHNAATRRRRFKISYDLRQAATLRSARRFTPAASVASGRSR